MWDYCYFTNRLTQNIFLDCLHIWKLTKPLSGFKQMSGYWISSTTPRYRGHNHWTKKSDGNSAKYCWVILWWRYSYLQKGQDQDENYRSCRSQVFFKIGVLKNFASFTGKHLCWSLFLITLQVSQKIMFSIKDFFSKFDQICNFLRIWSYLLKKSLMENFIFCEACNAVKKRLQHRCFPVKFEKFHWPCTCT